jgi:hypothetical protein
MMTWKIFFLWKFFRLFIVLCFGKKWKIQEIERGGVILVILGGAKKKIN